MLTENCAGDSLYHYSCSKCGATGPATRPYEKAVAAWNRGRRAPDERVETQKRPGPLDYAGLVEENRKLRGILAGAYVALNREQWEDGPTDSEIKSLIWDVLDADGELTQICEGEENFGAAMRQKFKEFTAPKQEGGA
jgi:hypothetical protein